MDPVTRIEGHMKIELTIDEVQGHFEVVDTRCTGTLFRGFEILLQGRDPWDATVLTSRICGVCPVSHALAATEAIEAVSGYIPNSNARLLRNLVLGANFIQSHILHFYLLAALDFVEGPRSAPWTPAWSVDRRGGTDIGQHLGAAVKMRRRAHSMGAVFGGKMPIPHTYVPGGVTAVPNESRIKEFRDHLTSLTSFTRNTYIPDVESLSSVYADYHEIGVGPGKLLAYGVFDLDEAGNSKLLERGTVPSTSRRDVIAPLATAGITEDVAYSWYRGTNAELAPAAGVTDPLYPKGKAYSWLKAPRYRGRPYEVGPLARMWITGDYRKGPSVMDRHLARAHETLKVARAMSEWLDQLTPGGAVYLEYVTPNQGSGVGLTEAPRGALGHWIGIDGGKIEHYQVVTPTCWNASPRDGDSQPGPLERALIGTPIERPEQPIEALRVIHSFDPCMSCAVHVMRPAGKPIVVQTGGRCA
jgi:hydrogenase large subunit